MEPEPIEMALCIFTTRIRRMGEGNIFTLCVSPHLDRGGIPHHRSGQGVPHPRSGWEVPGVDGGGCTRGTPPTPTPIRQSSIASTCYPAGGMPLAFTQEDFLVCKSFHTAMGLGPMAYQSILHLTLVSDSLCSVPGPIPLSV